MKLRLIYFRQILLTAILIICYQHEVFSQGTDISSGKQQSLYIGINLGPSRTLILNEGIQKIKDLSYVKKNSFFGSLEVGYFFSKNFGISSGVGFNSFQTQLALNPYENNYNTTDSENEAYNRRVSGQDITELQKVAFLNIPICINLQLPFGYKFGFFLQPGINLSIPVSKKYSSSGTFTFTGYYPAYNVLLQDLPAYSFSTNVKSNSEGDLELKSFTTDLLASAGFFFFLQQKIQVAIGVTYDKSLSSISNYSTPENFQLSSDVDEINSMMGGSSKVSAQSMGLKIVFRYYLK
jgi:hypothetical protein